MLTKIVQFSVGNLRVVFVHRLVLILYVVRDRSLFRGGGSIIFKRGKRGGTQRMHLTELCYTKLCTKQTRLAERLAKNVPHKGEGQETLNMVCPQLQ